MSVLIKKYFKNPLASLWEAVRFSMELRGYIRAAEELHRLGYHREAEEVINKARELAASN